MASKRERKILEKEVLPPVGEAADELPKGKVIGFMAVKGNLYNRKLMVVGRAVYGGPGAICPSQLAEPDECKCYSEVVKRNYSGGDNDCPLEWVKDYNSPFWRVIGKVMEGLGIASGNDPWFSYLVWSNLYKVSPAKGGNPGNKLCDIQLEGCKSLFDAELDIHRPSRLLLLAGWDWARDFVTSDCQTDNNAGFVEATGRRKETRIVVAKHPQGKPEAEWVKNVLAAF